MALPTQLNATEQDTLVKQIGLSLLRAAPRDWRRVTAEYRAVGRYHELTGEIVLADGTTQEWVATHDIASLFGRLRTGMYREGRGTWFNARYELDHPSSYNLEYDRDEPQWDLTPPPQAYADELRMFPRDEENVPDWLMRRMAGLSSERSGPRFRTARIFDGMDAEGRPVLNRPELDVEDQDRLLDYLDGAPVVVPGRGFDTDRLTASPESNVPIAFHSDGTWIWPAAVNYYLREYGIAPEPELVEHIRAGGFTIPDVPDPIRQAAAGHVSRGAPPPQRPGAAAPGADTEDGEPEQSAPRGGDRQPAAPPQPQPAQAPPPQEPPPPPAARQESPQAEPLGDRPRERPDHAADSHQEREGGWHDDAGERTRFAAPPGFATPPDPDLEIRDHSDRDYDDSTAETVEHHMDAYSDLPEHEEVNAERTRIARPALYPGTQGHDERYPDEQDYDDYSVSREKEHGGAQPAPGPHKRGAGRDPYADDPYTGPGRAGYPASNGHEPSGTLDHLEPTGNEQPTTYTPVPVTGNGLSTTASRGEFREEDFGRDVDGAESADSQQPTDEQPLPPRPSQPTDEQPLPPRPPQRPEDENEGPPTEYSSGPLVYDEPALDDLQDQLDDLGIARNSYRIGEPAERGWALEQISGGWRVGWYDDGLKSPAVFGDVEDAAAFMLGKLLLLPNGAMESVPEEVPWEPAQAADTPAPQQAEPAPPQRPMTTTLSPEAATGSRPPAPEAPRAEPPPPPPGAPAPPPPVARGEDPAPAGRRPQGPPAGPPSREAARPVAAEPSGAPPRNGRPAASGKPAASEQSGGKSNQQWPIQPFGGEPPLTLFRGKEMRDLPIGSEIDRFGGPTGNLTYAAGTPFEERSLVPEWVNRPYHVYRVQRPLHALAGVAIPWFSQPGGGAAYLLPASIEELLADGDIIELEPGEPPVD